MREKIFLRKFSLLLIWFPKIKNLVTTFNKSYHQRCCHILGNFPILGKFRVQFQVGKFFSLGKIPHSEKFYSSKVLFYRSIWQLLMCVFNSHKLQMFEKSLLKTYFICWFRWFFSQFSALIKFLENFVKNWENFIETYWQDWLPYPKYTISVSVLLDNPFSRWFY
jgi:hypothetical protein